LDKSQRLSRNVVNALIQIRRDRGISQERLAKLSGLSRTAITMMELGQRNPSLFVCHALATALSVKLAPIIARAERMGARASGPTPRPQRQARATPLRQR